MQVQLEKVLPKSQESQIKESESALVINNEYDRQVEASLFIDKKFISYAIVTGVVDKPERVFGEKAWADYLDGRLFARKYWKKSKKLNMTSRVKL